MRGLGVMTTNNPMINLLVVYLSRIRLFSALCIIFSLIYAKVFEHFHMIKSYAGQITKKYSFSNLNLDNNKRKDSAGLGLGSVCI